MDEEDPLLLKTTRNGVVHAQQGNILMFTEIKEQLRAFQNFVKHFFRNMDINSFSIFFYLHI